MAWIEPLELQTMLVSVFAGDATYFTAIALFAIIALGAYFRMSMLTLGLMVFVFLVMFPTIISSPLLILVSIFGALFVAWMVTKIVKN